MSRIISDEEIRDTYYPQTSRDSAIRLRAVAIAQRNASDREWVLEVEQLRQEIENKWASAEMAGLDQSDPKMKLLVALSERLNALIQRAAGEPQNELIAEIKIEGERQ